MTTIEPTTPAVAPAKKGLRKFSWFILAVNVLFLVWIIGGVSSASSSSNCTGLDAQTCRDATAIGTGIGAILIIALWAFADVILGIIWLVTRPRQR